MISSKSSCLFLVTCLLCSGCYESKYPLSAPPSPLDQRLLQNWVEQAAEPAAAGRTALMASFFQFSATEYVVVFSSDNESATPARAYTTMIDGVSVLTLQGIESQDPAYRTFVFFKYAFTADNRLQTWMISRDSPLLKNKTFSSRAAFSAYIKKHIHDKSLFDGMRVFKPVESMTLRLIP